MEVLVPITLFGWVFVATALFTVLPPRRAVLAAYLLAWLFLPQAGIPIIGLPDLDKVTATGMGAIIGVILFDAGRLARWRPSWVDLPMIIWIAASMPSALTNEPPPDGSAAWYDGVSGVVRDIFLWGIPYLIGRLYFSDLEGLKELALGIFIGGLIYAPLCAWEIRMSPQLHNLVYGFHPSHFAMTVRFGGYRPMVFMQHGLMVGMWMTSATLVGVWLWYTGALRTIFNLPMWLVASGMVVITVLCKSMGALALLAVGLAVLFGNRFTRLGILLVAAVMITPLYMYVRAEGLWDAKQLVEFAASISEDRAASLQGRLDDEDLLIERASQKPWFGWGGWGRWRIYDEWTGEDITASDGMWVIARGEKGLVGLVSITAVLLLPFLLLLKRVPARHWSHPMYAPAAALAVLLMLYSMDNLLNAMINPIFLLACGGLSGFYVAFPRLQAHIRQTQQQMMAAMMAQQQRLRARLALGNTP